MLKNGLNGLEIVAVEELTPYEGRIVADDIPSIAVSEVNGKDYDPSVSGDIQMDTLGAPVILAPGDPERANWGGKMEFLMTCIGYAVGLGNVWRFPYLCYKNGGGAFLIPYVLMLVLVGLPLFFMELAFGQFASLGPITVWRINPLFKGLGYAMVIVSWIISLYYNVIIAQVMFYLFASFTDKLPWTSCDNPWNTNSCLPWNYTQRNQQINTTENTTHSTLTPLVGTSLEWINQTLVKTYDVVSNFSLSTTPGSVNLQSTTLSPQVMNTPAEEYYSYFVLQKSSSIEEFGTLNWKLTLCLLLSWIIVGGALIKGVQSLGKIVYFTAIFPYLMLTVLLIRGVTLDGAVDGIVYYVKPEFHRLADPRVWSDAATQIFYSLSACSGGLIAMSSFNKFTNSCHRDAVIVAVLNSCTSIFAGFVIFSILGFMAYEKGVDVSTVAKGGPGLAFEVYPEALSRMVVSPMWAVFFFLMMATLGFGSQFSIVECVMSAMLDEFPKLMRSSKITIAFRLSVIIVAFGLGIPLVCNGGIYLLELVDYSVGGFPLLIVGIVECIAINWIYGFSNFWRDVEMMIGDTNKLYWKACWTVISPLVILATIILNVVFYKEPTYNGVPFPDWSKSLGWMIVMFPVSAIIVWFIYYYCKKGGFRLLKMRSMPLPHWGPALANDRKDRYSPERMSQQNFGTLEYQIGDKIYRSHLDVQEVARLLTGSTTTLNTMHSHHNSRQVSRCPSTATLGMNPPVPQAHGISQNQTPTESVYGSKTSIQ